MGTSSFPSSGSPSSLSLPSLHSPLDDWFTSINCGHLAAQSVPRDGLSSISGSSSSSSSPVRPQRRPFLQSNDLDGPFHLQAHVAFSQIGSPVVSSDSASKEKPESPLNNNSGCVSAMSNYSLPKSNATESPAPQHFQAFHGGFNQLGNSILKPLEQNTSSCMNSVLTSASASASAVALSSPASVGAGVTKVGKRRARINKKAPIAVLSADTSNFRAMVQQLTGIPPSHTSPNIWGCSGAPLVRPQPTRFAYNGGLPTLDTSASFLGPRQIFPFLQRVQQPPMNGLLSGGASNNNAELTSSQGRSNIANYDALSPSLHGLWDGVGNGTIHTKENVKEFSAANLVTEREQSFPRQASSLVESLLMSDDDVQAKLSFNAIDSWLAVDGGALVNHSPRMDLAKIASSIAS